VASFYADALAVRSGQSRDSSMLVLGSDQSMLRTAWTAAAKDVRAHTERDGR